jgi:hypothetical protein
MKLREASGTNERVVSTDGIETDQVERLLCVFVAFSTEVESLDLRAGAQDLGRHR